MCLPGAVGLQGAVGDKGPVGDTGDKGPVGDTGDKGIVGDKGPDGDQGPVGDQGSAGPVAGSNTQVIYNDNGSAAGATNLFYKKSGGFVGIGVQNPLNELDVIGDIRVRGGDIRDAGGTTRISIFDNGRLELREDNGFPKLTIATNGKVGINTTNPLDNLHVIGRLRVSSLPFGDYRNVQWRDSTGQFYYDNSSRRYKENIKPLEDDFAALLNAKPVTYTRPGRPGRWEIGFIAEDFHDVGLTRLVDYDAEGLPDGINYEKICLYITEIIKGQQTQIEQLKAENCNAKKENEQLREKLTALADRQEALETMFLALSTTLPKEKLVKLVDVQ